MTTRIFLDENLSCIDWSGVVPENERNVDKLFSRFYNKLNKLTNKHAPLKPVSKRKIKMFCKPWITGRIRKSSKIENKLLSMGNTALNKRYWPFRIAQGAGASFKF